MLAQPNTLTYDLPLTCRSFDEEEEEEERFGCDVLSSANKLWALVVNKNTNTTL